MDRYPITGTTSIVVDLVVPDGGTLSFGKINQCTKTNVVGDYVIFHNSITRGIAIIVYATTISIDRTISKRETLSGLEVDAITTIIGDCHVLDTHVRSNSVNPRTTRIMDSKVRDSGASSSSSEVDSISSTLCDRIVLYRHQPTCTGDVDRYPVTGTTSIVVDLVVPDGGALSFGKINQCAKANVVGDYVILHNSITRGIAVIVYATTISIDRTISKRKAFSGIEVDAIITVACDRDMLHTQI